MATSQRNSSADEKLSVALLNISGLRNNIPDIRHIIARHELHVVALCETKLDPSVKDSKVYIPGFRMWRRDRDRYGGGVALYVQDHIETKPRSDLMETKAKIFWVEMKLPDGRPVLLGCCYRPPHKDAEYLFQYNEILSMASKEKEEKDVLLMGDFNTEWTIPQRNNGYVSSEWGLTQIVKDRTKFANKISTCIDHIYTNIPDLCSEPKSIVTGCSDHNLITVTVEKWIPKKMVTFRPIPVDPNEFRSSMQEVQWTGVYEESNPQEALDTFTETFLSVADKHAPLESRDIYDPLRLDEQMESLISERDEARWNMICRNHAAGCVSKEEDPPVAGDESEGDEKQKNDTENWKRLKDRVLKCNEKRQKDCLQQQFERANLDPGQLLKIFEECVGKSLPCHVINIRAEETATSEKIPGADEDPEGLQVQQVRRNGPDKFRFRETDDETVRRWLVHLCDHVIHRIDETEAELMKLAADHISAPIGHILNRCINSKMIPDELKKIHTFQFSENGCLCFRQSSSADRLHILLGYVFDIILFMKAVDFFLRKNLISSLTPEKEMKEIKTAWLTASEADKTVSAAFLDFSSAFNTISHDLLINKLSEFGFSGSALHLIKSFLSYQEGRKCSRGLLPGSFLADLLFSVFINYLIRDIKTSLKTTFSCDSYIMMVYIDGDPENLETELDHKIQSVRRSTNQFYISFDETRPEPVEPVKMSDIFSILESLFRCHGDELDWIRALRNIVQHCKDWSNHKIEETLQKYFGKNCLKSVPAEVMESLINSLLLSELDLRGSSASAEDTRLVDQSACLSAKGNTEVSDFQIYFYKRIKETNRTILIKKVYNAKKI